MKTKPYNHLTRIITSAILGLLLTTTVSCKGPDADWIPFGNKEEPSLKERYDDLQTRLQTSEATAKKATDDVALWQGVAALFIVLAGFALVYGAALGSQARRIQPTPTANPESTDHEVVL